MWNRPSITLLLQLRGLVVTKGREIIIFVKSQSPFDVHRQYLSVSLIDLQAKVSRFRCRIFHCFVNFSKIYLDCHWFLSLKSYQLMIFLHLESFVNKLFELNFSIFQEACFYSQSPFRKVNFFAWLRYICFMILAPFHI